MYNLEYMKSQSTGFSHNSNSSNESGQEEKLDFTKFLNKLAYQMIFNHRDISSKSSSIKNSEIEEEEGNKASKIYSL